MWHPIRNHGAVAEDTKPTLQEIEAKLKSWRGGSHGENADVTLW